MCKVGHIDLNFFTVLDVFVALSNNEDSLFFFISGLIYLVILNNYFLF